MEKREWYSVVNYGAIVESWGKKVLAFETTGAYQGDHWALLKNSYGQFGFLNLGYGSCSGCDYLEGIFDFNRELVGDDRCLTEAGEAKLAEVSRSYYEAVRWFDTAEELISWLDNSHDRLGDSWFYHDDEFTNGVLPKFKQLALENS